MGLFNSKYHKTDSIPDSFKSGVFIEIPDKLETTSKITDDYNKLKDSFEKKINSKDFIVALINDLDSQITLNYDIITTRPDNIIYNTLNTTMESYCYFAPYLGVKLEDVQSKMDLLNNDSYTNKEKLDYLTQNLELFKIKLQGELDGKSTE